MHEWADGDRERLDAVTRAQRLIGVVGSISEAPEILNMRNETLLRLADGKARRAQTRRTGLSVAACGLAFVCASVFGVMQFYGTSPVNLAQVEKPAVQAEAGTDLAVASIGLDLAPVPLVYSTSIGERLTVVLTDGSELTLDTSSEVSVDFHEDSRRVNLRKGRALFDVAHDADRPFRVFAAGRRITALGTTFDVKLDGTDLKVTLVEGKVKVEADRDPPIATVEVPVKALNDLTIAELDPGEQFAQADETGPGVKRSVDAQRLTSWSRGLLIFDDDTVGAVVGELNRYSRKKIVLSGEDVAELRISGAFEAGQSLKAGTALATYFQLDLKILDEGNIVLSAQ